LALPANSTLVVDTNVLVRALADPGSASGRLVRLCETRAVRMLLSRAVLREYRDVLGRDELTHKHPKITPEVVQLVIERLRYFAHVITPVRARFRYPRDPDDECFIELAISGAATHIVTHDNDLLSLPGQHTDAGKRFRQRLPAVRVCTPLMLIEEFGL
jgi:putative PIN family toxin of toxin-antitoxin system